MPSSWRYSGLQIVLITLLTFGATCLEGGTRPQGQQTPAVDKPASAYKSPRGWAAVSEHAQSSDVDLAPQVIEPHWPGNPQAEPEQALPDAQQTPASSLPPQFGASLEGPRGWSAAYEAEITRQHYQITAAKRPPCQECSCPSTFAAPEALLAVVLLSAGAFALGLKTGRRQRRASVRALDAHLLPPKGFAQIKAEAEKTPAAFDPSPSPDPREAAAPSPDEEETSCEGSTRTSLSSATAPRVVQSYPEGPSGYYQVTPVCLDDLFRAQDPPATGPASEPNPGPDPRTGADPGEKPGPSPSHPTPDPQPAKATSGAGAISSSPFLTGTPPRETTSEGRSEGEPSSSASPLPSPPLELPTLPLLSSPIPQSAPSAAAAVPGLAAAAESIESRSDRTPAAGAEGPVSASGGNGGAAARPATAPPGPARGRDESSGAGPLTEIRGSRRKGPDAGELFGGSGAGETSGAGWEILQGGLDFGGLVKAMLQQGDAQLPLDAKLTLMQMYQSHTQHEDRMRLKEQGVQFAGAHVELVGRGLAEKRVRHATLAMRERTAALQSLLDDCLLFGLAVIGAAVAYCGVWRGTRLMQCPELSDLPSFSMFTPFARMQRIGEVLLCWFWATGDMLVGAGLILGVAWAVVRGRVFHSAQRAPMVKLVLGLGIVCAAAGRYAITRLGGDGEAWLALWWTWVLALMTASWQAPWLSGGVGVAPQAQGVAGGPEGGTPADRSGWVLPLYYGVMAVLLPLAAGVGPFARDLGLVPRAFRHWWF